MIDKAQDQDWRTHFKCRQGILEVVRDTRKEWISLWRREASLRASTP